ncbi:MAG: beta-lactamase family protein [Thermoanaerobaculia bacterium]|nr:beta-lactamase family protein [Thermoanaerobaculia bacterium]
MNKLMCFLLGVLLIGVGVGCQPSEPPTASRELPVRDGDDRLEQLETWLEASGIPAVAVALIRDGDVAWTAALGRTARGEPVDPSSMFNVASLTKPVFATMVLHLVAGGEIGLDQPVAEYFTDEDFAGDARESLLTPRLILSHQTGLPNWRSIPALEFVADPGETFSYSGEAYEYLLRAVEQKMSSADGQLVRGRVFEPAGMQSATLGWSDEVEERFAYGADASSEPVTPWMSETRRTSFSAGGMVSSFEDYARFVAWTLRGADLPKDLFDAIREREIRLGPHVSWGLGWTLLDVEQPDSAMGPMLYHGGGEDGTRTFVAVSPETRDGIVVFTNSSSGDALIYQIVGALFDRGGAVLDRLSLMEMYTLRAYWESVDVSEDLDLHIVDIHENPNRLPVLLLSAQHLLVERTGWPVAQKDASRQILGSLLDLVVKGQLSRSEQENLAGRLATPNPLGGLWHLRHDLSDGELERFVDHARTLAERHAAEG